jgi:uncharacterized cupredoxin-like copper-binding protein
MAIDRRLLLLTPLSAFAHGPQPHGSVRSAPPEQMDWGIAGRARDVRRTVELTMLDSMRFVPDRIEVREGETLRLRVKNAGRLMHEIVLGTPAELARHAEQMKKHPDMAHDEPYMAHVPAGRQGELIWRFNRAGRFEYACLIAGHFDAGMRGTLIVHPRKTS